MSKLSPKIRKKLTKALTAAVELMEKCGGPGGTPGPCPSGQAKPAGGGKKPPTPAKPHPPGFVPKKPPKPEPGDQPKPKDAPSDMLVGANPNRAGFRGLVRWQGGEWTMDGRRGKHVETGVEVQRYAKLDKDDKPGDEKIWLDKTGAVYED